MFTIAFPTVTCVCGSTNVASRYTFDLYGDVDGKRFDCADCGASDTI